MLNGVHFPPAINGEIRVDINGNGGRRDAVFPPIFRVSPVARREKAAAYEPDVIAIGPLHRNKESLAAVEPLVVRAREQYAEGISMTDEKLAAMFVLDGCFIIELMLKVVQKGRDDPELFCPSWVYPMVRKDLLLAENQIPFFVLDAIYKETNLGGAPPPPPILKIEQLAFLYLYTCGGENMIQYLCRSLNLLNAQHLLHLYHWSLSLGSIVGLQDQEAAALGSRGIKKKEPTFSSRSGDFMKTLLVFLIVALLFRLGKEKNNNYNNDGCGVPRMVLSATELNYSGIVFKKKRSAGKNTNFPYISFDADDGVMEMPPLVVDDASDAIFRNLIAFEQCNPNAAGNKLITSYMAFMGHLINTRDDVAMLMNAGIIESMLGSVDELVAFFNTMTTWCYFDYEEGFYLKQLFHEVHLYSKVKRHRWLAMLRHDYFGSPWASISFLAAAIVVASTVLSTFYTVYAYYSPPSP